MRLLWEHHGIENFFNSIHFNTVVMDSASMGAMQTCEVGTLCEDAYMFKSCFGARFLIYP
jgi:hypothetical protein